MGNFTGRHKVLSVSLIPMIVSFKLDPFSILLFHRILVNFLQSFMPLLRPKSLLRFILTVSLLLIKLAI